MADIQVIRDVVESATDLFETTCRTTGVVVPPDVYVWNRPVCAIID
jgi:hypothetical protein